MYLGFSRKSPHFKESVNPAFNAAKPISIGNYPTIVDPNSVAARLGVALDALKESGEAQRIYDEHFASVSQKKAVY